MSPGGSVQGVCFLSKWGWEYGGGGGSVTCVVLFHQ